NLRTTGSHLDLNQRQLSLLHGAMRRHRPDGGAAIDRGVVERGHVSHLEIPFVVGIPNIRRSAKHQSANSKITDIFIWCPDSFTMLKYWAAFGISIRD